MGGDQLTREKTGQTAADGAAGEHQHDQHAAQAARRVFVGERDRDRQRAGHAEARGEAQIDQLVDIGRPDSRQREGAEHQRAQRDRDATTETVGDHAENRWAEETREKAGAEQAAELRSRQVPLAAQHRRDEGRGRDVEPIGELHEETPEDDDEMKIAEFLTIDEFRQIDVPR